MNLKEVRDIAYEFIALHQLVDWKFRFNTRKRCLGLCRYREKTIELSVHFAQEAQEADILDTIKHEIVHALIGPGHGHDYIWKAMAIKVGATPKACADATVSGSIITTGARYVAACTCGVPHVKFRRPKRLTGWYCAKTKQNLEWKPNIPEGK